VVSGEEGPRWGILGILHIPERRLVTNTQCVAEFCKLLDPNSRVSYSSVLSAQEHVAGSHDGFVRRNVPAFWICLSYVECGGVDQFGSFHLLRWLYKGHETRDMRLFRVGEAINPTKLKL
jgi:hypothetical protein